MDDIAGREEKYNFVEDGRLRVLVSACMSLQRECGVHNRKSPRGRVRG